MMNEKKTTIREMCVIAIFAALTAICSQIAIPLPFTPVPISFGMVGLYITAILLSPKEAVLSQVCYLLIGALGLPVFGGFKGGVGALFGNTGGYLMVYPIMAAIISLALNGRRALRGENARMRKGANAVYVTAKGAMAICTAHLVMYLGGTVWLCLITGVTFVQGLTLAVFPYVVLDVVKIVFCVTVVIPLRKRVMRAGIIPRRQSEMADCIASRREEGLESKIN